jgi:hypothetical protein
LPTTNLATSDSYKWLIENQYINNKINSAVPYAGHQDTNDNKMQWFALLKIPVMIF